MQPDRICCACWDLAPSACRCVTGESMPAWRWAAPCPGNLAFVTQAGAPACAVLDWASSQGIGFSHFISLDASADVDFGDMLDYLGSDPATRVILLDMESVKSARKFMSAARAASRNKPVIVFKPGVDAAVTRAGMRVAT